MIESLIEIDKQLFIQIHNGLANDFLDQFLPVFREAKTWIPLYLIFAFFAFYRYRYSGFYILAAAGIIVLFADQFASGFMKPFFERLRPCHDPSLTEIIRPILDCGGQYGFVSSHAANHFGLAVIFSWFFNSISNWKSWQWVFYTWAGAISLAQVYVAKHFPADILVGGLAGLLIGWLIVTFLKKYVPIKSKHIAD